MATKVFNAGNPSPFPMPDYEGARAWKSWDEQTIERLTKANNDLEKALSATVERAEKAEASRIAVCAELQAARNGRDTIAGLLATRTAERNAAQMEADRLRAEVAKWNDPKWRYCNDAGFHAAAGAYAEIIAAEDRQALSDARDIADTREIALGSLRSEVERLKREREKAIHVARSGEIARLENELIQARGSRDYWKAKASAPAVGNPVLAEVQAERARQDAKHGEHNKGNTPHVWVSILAEEVGEFAEEALAVTGSSGTADAVAATDRARVEAIQVAAVAVAIVEDIDRKTAYRRDGSCVLGSVEIKGNGASCVTDESHARSTPNARR